ncbi:MAG TPA: hypothetical protein VFO50_05895 [Candidatus Limnocylindrales bacterium]|nr:hypothetical protein [Candidatus Limnocylindrales bacterium]
MTIEQLAGWSALVAAVATVTGAVFLILFFARGGFWGLLNDIASIVLMLATIPVALVVGIIELERVTTVAMIVTGIGIVGMLGATISQALLVARVRTYAQLLPWTLGSGAIVGVWYILAGVIALAGSLLQPLPWLMIVSGIGFIAIGYGFAVGNERHPLSVVGGLVLLVASTAFLGILGWQLVSGDLVVPDWNL